MSAQPLHQQVGPPAGCDAPIISTLENSAASRRIPARLFPSILIAIAIQVRVTNKAVQCTYKLKKEREIERKCVPGPACVLIDIDWNMAAEGVVLGAIGAEGSLSWFLLLLLLVVCVVVLLLLLHT